MNLSPRLIKKKIYSQKSTPNYNKEEITEHLSKRTTGAPSNELTTTTGQFGPHTKYKQKTSKDAIKISMRVTI